MNDDFLKDFLAYEAKRVEAMGKRLYTIIERDDAPYSDLPAEELRNLRDGQLREAIYIAGLSDGLRLAALLNGKSDNHV